VWTVVDKLPPGVKAISSRWLYRIKYNPDGSLAKYKSRLVARGFTQEEGIDYQSIFAPVARHTSLRVFLSQVASEDLECDQADVETAFLNAPLEEVIYMRLPDGTLVKLKKCIYGLKQSPHNWNKLLDDVLVKMGFTPTRTDPCLYTARINGILTYILIYVDDILIASRTQAGVNLVKDHLARNFVITDLGTARFFLGYQIDRSRSDKTLFLHQTAYSTQLLSRASILETDLYNYQSPATSKATATIDFDSSLPFASVVGGLLYLSNGTRPDLSFAVHQLCRFMHHPEQAHHQALLRLLLYLKGTLSYGITLGGSVAPLRGFADADHKRTGDCRSTSGYLFLLNQGPISWRSTTQKHPALSSCEAEYVALSMASQEALWLRSLLKELQLLPETPGTTIFGDNKGSLTLAEHPYDHCRTKHINLHAHFLKSYILSKDLVLKYCPTQTNIADLLTKALEPGPHRRLTNLIPVSDCPAVLK
jgi:hypothetical protein